LGVARILIVISLHFREKLFYHESTKFFLASFRVFVINPFWFRLDRVSYGDSRHTTGKGLTPLPVVSVNGDE